MSGREQQLAIQRRWVGVAFNVLTATFVLLFGFFCVSTLMLARGDFPFAVFTGACILILYYAKRRYMRKTERLQEGIREDFPT